MNYLSLKLNINKMEDWYQVTYDVISKNYLKDKY